MARNPRPAGWELWRNCNHEVWSDLVSVTKRRSSWACRGNPEPEQETIKGTHAQETSAYQRRPTTQHAVQGSNPPIRALYMQLAKIPRVHVVSPLQQANLPFLSAHFSKLFFRICNTRYTKRQLTCAPSWKRLVATATPTKHCYAHCAAL